MQTAVQENEEIAAVEPDSRAHLFDQERADAQADQRVSPAAWCLVAGVILVGLVFRAHLLDVFFLDNDESMHFQAARELTLKETWQASRTYTHPPLVFVFYHYWLNLGDSETMLRLPALIFSVPALLIGFLWLKTIAGVRPALVGLVFLTFSMPMVHLGAQMRSYTLLLTFMFAALYFHERFLQKQSIAALLGSAVCLTLAILTHYTTAWLMLVLGVLTLLRVCSGTLPRKLVATWALTQLWLLGVCVALYFGHVHAFVDSGTQTDLWDFWLNDSDYTVHNTEVWKIPLMRLLEFIKYTSGFIGFFIGLCILPAAIILWQETYRRTGSRSIAWERSLLILLPMLLAMLLFQLRIYPLGQTRHSMWLIPFLTLAISAATLLLFARRSLWWNMAITGLLIFWIVRYTVPITWQFETTQTPETANRFVSLIRETIPADQVILTDDSTRNVLEYYLVGRQVVHGKPLGGGYTEYQMGDYRVVTIPRFHFYMYQFRKDWENYLAALKGAAREPLWVVYLGYELPEAKPENLFPLFPAGQLMKQAAYLDNQIMKIRFTSPDISPAGKSGARPKS